MSKKAPKKKMKVRPHKKKRRRTKALAGHSAVLEDIHASIMDESEQDKLDWTNSETKTLPGISDVMQPFGWKVLVMPMRRAHISKGGILLPQIVQDSEMYLNYIGRIVALGPLSFRHSKYADMGLTETDTYKRGDWVIYPIYQYARIDFKGTKLIILNDDSFLGRVPEGVSPWDFKVER